MIAISIALALAATDVEKINLDVVASRPDHYVNKNLRLCGKVEIPRTFPKDRLLTVEQEFGKAGIFIDPAHPQLVPGVSEGCFDGQFRRQDGLTTEEARRQGKTMAVVDGLNRLFMFYALPKKASQRRR